MKILSATGGVQANIIARPEHFNPAGSAKDRIAAAFAALQLSKQEKCRRKNIVVSCPIQGKDTFPPLFFIKV